VITEAHGICVVLVMLITTLLLMVMLLVLRVNAVWVVLFFTVYVDDQFIYTLIFLLRYSYLERKHGIDISYNLFNFF
jgi:KUP system potassium uptake protein